MELIEVGIDFRTAGADLLDRCAIASEQQPQLLREVRSVEVPEALILSTCQRTEFYCTSPAPERATAILIDRFRRMSCDDDEAAVIARRGGDVVRHIVAVAAGLESARLGEHEILGQVRRAYLTAQETGTVGPILGHLFQHAIECGRNIRSALGIGGEKWSLTETAAAWVAASVESPGECTAAVVGAGEMACEMLACLKRVGIRRVFVFSRRAEHGRSIAAKFGGHWGGFDDFIPRLKSFDLIVCATSSPTPILTEKDLHEAAERSPRDPLFIIDLGMPRNVEPTVSALPHVRLLDMPAVLSLAVTKSAQRAEWAGRVRWLIDKSVEEFLGWQRVRVLAPVLEALRSHYEETILQETLRIRPGTDQNRPPRDEMQRFAFRLAGKLLHPIFSGLKEIIAREALRRPEEAVSCLLPGVGRARRHLVRGGR